jgi:hypothetical protein
MRQHHQLPHPQRIVVHAAPFVRHGEIDRCVRLLSGEQLGEVEPDRRGLSDAPRLVVLGRLRPPLPHEVEAIPRQLFRLLPVPPLHHAAASCRGARPASLAGRALAPPPPAAAAAAAAAPAPWPAVRRRQGVTMARFEVRAAGAAAGHAQQRQHHHQQHRQQHAVDHRSGMRGSLCRWPVVMTPRNGKLRANEAVASHRAAGGAGPSIKVARTYARGISSGAAAMFSCAWTASAGTSGLLARPRPLTNASKSHCLPQAPTYSIRKIFRAPDLFLNRSASAKALHHEPSSPSFNARRRLSFFA